MATGANTTPLGPIHPILAARFNQGGGAGGLLPTPQMEPTISLAPAAAPPPTVSLGSKDPELKRHLEAAKRAANALFPEEPAKKRRRSRWGSEATKTAIPGLPTVLPANMTEQQQKIYLLHLKIEEHSRMLRTGDLGILSNPVDRSPSPEPIYSHDGKRLNTREVRVRKRLEDERHSLIQQAIKLNPEYKPPADYKAPNRKFEDKVFIPQDDHPETNFVGLLIGPRGNTLKQLERESSTKIMIRGKGATKEGKMGRFGLPQPGEDEPLHALITGQTPEAVKNAVDKIKAIIQSGIDVPGNDNEIKKMQLMQLAELNGTFKPLDILRCSNCGSTTHRTWQCSDQVNVTSNVICTRCGGGGHIAADCKVNLNSSAVSNADKAKMDSEYLSLMKELGESVPAGRVPTQDEAKKTSFIPRGRGGGGRGSLPLPRPMQMRGGPPQQFPPGPHQQSWMFQPPPPGQFSPHHPSHPPSHPPPHHSPHHPPHHPHPPGHGVPMMMRPGGPAPHPWGAPVPGGPPHPHMFGPPGGHPGGIPGGIPHQSFQPPPPPPPPGSGPPPSSSSSSSAAPVVGGNGSISTTSQAPLAWHTPAMSMQPWQQQPPQPHQPYPPMPSSLPRGGGGAMSPPPPPPPEQSWAGAPPPPPPPPAES